MPGLDKVIHAALFALLAVTTRRRYGRGLGLVLGYAGLSEVLQAVLPIHRDGDVLDFLADSACALAGWAGAWTPGRVRNGKIVGR